MKSLKIVLSFARILDVSHSGRLKNNDQIDAIEINYVIKMIIFFFDGCHKAILLHL